LHRVAHFVAHEGKNGPVFSSDQLHKHILNPKVYSHIHPIFVIFVISWQFWIY